MPTFGPKRSIYRWRKAASEGSFPRARSKIDVEVQDVKERAPGEESLKRFVRAYPDADRIK